MADSPSKERTSALRSVGKMNLPGVSSVEYYPLLEIVLQQAGQCYRRRSRIKYDHGRGEKM